MKCFVQRFSFFSTVFFLTLLLFRWEVFASNPRFYDPNTRQWYEIVTRPQQAQSFEKKSFQKQRNAQRAHQIRQERHSRLQRNDTRLRVVSATSPVPRQLVSYNGKYGAGTVVINTSERRLYYVLPGGKAIRYGVGVGRNGFQWNGSHRISRKAEWPGWTPPAQMRAREAAKGRRLPAYMPGGLNNPLGARALYLGSTLYRIHGSNEPWTIGMAVSSGCFRMTNEDITHLYSQVSVGTRVVVLP